MEWIVLKKKAKPSTLSGEVDGSIEIKFMSVVGLQRDGWHAKPIVEGLVLVGQLIQ